MEDILRLSSVKNRLNVYIIVIEGSEVLLVDSLATVV